MSIFYSIRLKILRLFRGVLVAHGCVSRASGAAAVGCVAQMVHQVRLDRQPAGGRNAMRLHAKIILLSGAVVLGMCLAAGAQQAGSEDDRTHTTRNYGGPTTRSSEPGRF